MDTRVATWDADATGASYGETEVCTVAVLLLSFPSATCLSRSAYAVFVITPGASAVTRTAKVYTALPSAGRYGTAQVTTPSR